MQDVFVDSQSGVAYRKRKKKYTFAGFILSFLIMTLILWSVIALDFVLFAQSGGASLFDGGFFFRPEISVVLAGILVFSAGMMLLSCFSRKLQAFLIAVFCGVIAWGMMSQFLLPDKTTFLSTLLLPYLGTQVMYLSGYSHYLAALVAFFVVYWLLSSKTNSRLVFLTVMLVALFGVLAKNHLQNDADSVFQETFAENNIENQAPVGKIVYLFLPNFSSFPAIGDTDEKDLNKNGALKDVMQGFLFKNNFKVYQNAYVTDNNPFVNIAQILNFLDNKPIKSHLAEAKTEPLWDFSRLNQVSVQLKDNHFSDSFKKAGYKVSAYQSRGIDLCGKNGKQEADRCVYKADFPVYPVNVTASQKVFLLLGQWIASMDLINLPMFESYVHFALDAQQSAALKLPYEKMYVLNSEKVLDKLQNDLHHDEGANVYAAYVDLPSDLLIYNEYCQLKPTKQWNTQTVDSASIATVRDYNEQMMCTLGLLQNFINGTRAENITLVIIGAGGRTGQAAKADKTLDFSDTFKNAYSVFFAVKEPHGRFILNRQVCSVPTLIKNYLLNTEGCEELAEFAVNDVLKTKTTNYLSEHTISPENMKNAGKAFSAWFMQWLKVNKEVQKAEFSYVPIPKSSVETQDYDMILHAGKAISDKFLNETSVVESDVQEEDSLVPAENENDVTVEESEVSVNSGETAMSQEQDAITETSEEANQLQDKKDEKTEDIKEEVKVEDKQNSEEKQEISEANEDAIDIPLEVVTISEPEVKAVTDEVSAKLSEETEKQSNEANDVKQEETAVETVQKEVISEEKIEKNPEVVGPSPKVSELKEILSHDDKPAVSGDFLLEDDEEWELNPAKALGLDPSVDTQERIVVKVK